MLYHSLDDPTLQFQMAMVMSEAPYVIFSRSSLTPVGTGFVLVEQRVTWQAGKDPVRQATLSFSLTRERSETFAGGKLVASSATHGASPANSRVRAIKRVELFGLGDGAVRTLRQGRRDATGELQTRICVGVAVKVAYLSGQCCCTQLGLAALCASGSAFFLQSETVAIVTGTCWWDGGKTAL